MKFLKTSIEPSTDTIYGEGYRASVTLIDGLYLPGVLFRNSSKLIDLAVRRFKEEKSGKSIFGKSSEMGYRNIVKNFVASGNCINSYNIVKVDKSDFSLPRKTLKQIHGETKMGWTGFVAKMQDGNQSSFGTSFLLEFFDLPNGYKPTDIIEIINHSYLDKEANFKSYDDPNVYKEFSKGLVFRERPYFECYLDNL